MKFITDLNTILTKIEKALEKSFKKSTVHISNRPLNWFGTELTSDLTALGSTASPYQIKRIYDEEKSNPAFRSIFRKAVVETPDEIVSELIDSVTELLVSNDISHTQLSHVLPSDFPEGSTSHINEEGLIVSSFEISVSSLCRALITSSILIGASRALSRLQQWCELKTIEFDTCLVVNIVLDKKIVRLEGGCELTPLPMMPKDLPSYVPYGNSVSSRDYIGHSILSIKSNASPVLFSTFSIRDPTFAISSTVKIEDILQILSVICDDFIESGIIWSNFGDIDTVRDIEMIPWVNRSTLRRNPFLETASDDDDLLIDEISQTRINHSFSVDDFNLIMKQWNSIDPQIRNAVSRWRKSMDPEADLVDVFTDIRIALESLLLSNSVRTELGFQIALRGAWFLGKCPEQREEIFHTLRQAYNIASAAIHSGEVSNRRKRNRNNLSNVDIIERSQELCRRCIIDMIKRNSIPNWTQIVLGSVEPVILWVRFLHRLNAWSVFEKVHKYLFYTFIDSRSRS